MRNRFKTYLVWLGAIAVAVMTILLCMSECLYSVDKIFSDPLYYMESTSDTSIKIIAIDEKTLEALGPMNTWNRNVSAELIEILTEDEDMKPAVIAMDIMYMGNIEAESDRRFAEACKKAGNVIVASNVIWKDRVMVNSEGNYIVDHSKVDMIELPYEDLRSVSKHGFANAFQDRDGYIRFEKYCVDNNGVTEKSFTSEVYEEYCQLKGIEVQMPKTFGEDLFYFTYSGKNSSYEVVSLIDVLEGVIDVRAFDDCVVMVGAYAPGMMDAYNVAVQRGAQMYGVEIHANVLEALIEGKTAVPVSDWIYAIVIAVVSVSFYFVNRKVKQGYAAVIMGVLIILNVVVGKVLFHNGYVMDIIYLPLTLVVTYVALLAVRYALFNRKYTEALKEQMYSFADAFATAVDERTPYNGTHTQKVAEYVVAYCKYSNMLYRKRITDEYFDKNRIEQLRLAAILHDIGKMIIPTAIMNKGTRLDKNIANLDARYKYLNACYEVEILSERMSEEEGRAIQKYLEDSRQFIHDIDGAGFLSQEKLDRVADIGSREYITPDGEHIPFLTDYEKSCLEIQKGTLTAEERSTMESHVVMTKKILSKVRFHSFHKDVPSIAANHHEFLNGTGYPYKKNADDLSIDCRILTIADIYDALTSVDRPYKIPMPREKAFSILEAMVGEGKLDGQLVKWFEEAMEYFYKETKDEKDK